MVNAGEKLESLLQREEGITFETQSQMRNNGQRYCYQGIVLDPLIQIKGFTCLSLGSQGQVFTLSALFI